jgi:CheY-like chemotaxis protein
MATCVTEPRRTAFTLARVLLVDAEPASRLALQTVLQAGGYDVESAASSAEAIGKLEEGEFELVLSDLSLESPDAGRRVMAHAQITPYKPATAFISTTYNNATAAPSGGGPILIASEDLPALLTKVADLIGARAQRRAARVLRHAGAY